MKLVGDQDESITVELSEFGPKGTPGEGDLLIDVSVSIGGYSATGQYWVAADDWTTFIRELRDLEQTRSGKAELHGASPEQFLLALSATSAAGPMCVSGTLGWRLTDTRMQELRFSFEFDGGFLGALLHDLDGFRA